MQKSQYAIIMAGGIGSRFWPFSRAKYPKQFHDVLGTGKSLLQQTVSRLESTVAHENIIVVTNQDYMGLVKEQLPFLNDHQILGEPVGRNTAPCIAYACYKIYQKNKQANVIVLPSDHIIREEKKFADTLKIALEATASSDLLVTLGIKPTRPDTGYGYIQFIEDKKQKIKKVKTFTEKPALDLAKVFLDSGDFLWNSGIFVWNVSSVLKAFAEYMPDMAETFSEGNGTYWTDGEKDFITKAYSQCRNISIDYGILEKAPNVYVVPSDFGWSDLGTWKSLYDNSDKNENGNVIDANAMTYETTNCIIKMPKDKLVVVEGLEDYIVAEYDGVLMICRKDREQRVKDFVADAKANKGTKFI
jgi:mannose-1-phosphate guanylyltransferase